jgi:hypothetical protein
LGQIYFCPAVASKLAGCLRIAAETGVTGQSHATGFASYFEANPRHERPRRIVLSRCGYISGRAIDVETGEPVAIQKVIVCDVKRDAKGTPHSYGCGEARFEQTHKGQFRVAVSTHGEKHLMVLAAGYHTSENYVLNSDPFSVAKDVTLKMRRNGSPKSAAGQRIRGTVRFGGKPAAVAWVSLWQKRQEWNSVNLFVERGRTIDGTYRSWMVDVLTNTDGTYLLDVADPGEYYVTACPHDGAPALSPPIAVRTDEEKTCDLVLPAGATLRGRVRGVAPEIAQRLWIVAFARAPFRATTPVDREGEFTLVNVPPGEIGLKVGHEGYLDADVARQPWSKDAFDAIGKPWKRAVVVNVQAGVDIGGLELHYGPPGPPDGFVE